MLDNVKEFTSMKMEGKSDNIEFTLPTEKIYAQAKSVTMMITKAWYTAFGVIYQLVLKSLIY